MSSNKCARCDQTVYPVEGLRCLDKIWHKGCFKCQECNMTLNMKNYKGFEKKPYCNAHCPQAKATTVADTPEIRRLAETTRIQSQAKYHEDFEKSKGKGYTAVADDVELQRIKNTSKIISNVAYHGELERKKQMEEKRGPQTIDDLSPNHHHSNQNNSHTSPNHHHQQHSQSVRNSVNQKQLDQYNKVSPTHQQRQPQQQQQQIKQQTPVHYHAQDQQLNGHQSVTKHRQVPQNQVDGVVQQQPHQHKQMVKTNSQQIHPQQQILLLQQQQQQLLLQQQQQLQHRSSLSMEQQEQLLKQSNNNNNNNHHLINNNNSHMTKQQMQMQMQIQMNMQHQQRYPMKFIPPNEALPMMNNQAHHHHHQHHHAHPHHAMLGPQVAMSMAQQVAPANGQRIAAQNPAMIPAMHPAMMQGYNSQQVAHLNGPHHMPNKQQPGSQQYSNRGAQVKPGNQQQQQQHAMMQNPSQRLSGHLQQMPLGPMGHHNPQMPPQASRRMFRALYDYIANDVDEVSFFENDLLIDCVNVDGNWLIGKVARSGQTGMLPANYVTEFVGQ